MSSDKGSPASASFNADFVGCDEYDIVSSNDLLLTTDKNYESKYEENVSIENSFNKTKFSSAKKYKEEWNELYGNKELDLEKLRQKSVEGQLRTSHFRSICWRCLLGILNKQPEQWLFELHTYRNHYDEVCAELAQNPWNVKDNNPHDNPLSQESNSVWQKYFCDEELKSVVHQDVKRTFPGMDFFRKEEIQDMMVRILFCYARQNPALCYRQVIKFSGMHEILAPLIFILHCDHQAFLHAKEQSLIIDQAMDEILNPENLEQDAFSIFKFIMNHIECSYRINNLMTSSTGQFPVETKKYENKTCHNEVILRLENIKKTILQVADPKLNEHLEKLDIPLHLFGIRWLRLLFGREFPLQDLLVLWDFIFANNFETVNYIVVAMLVAVRQILLKGDYTDCLCYLMRYPNGVDITYVIEYALHLKDPLKHPLPDSLRILNLPNAYVNKSYFQPNRKNINVHLQPKRRLKKESSRPPQWLLGKSNLALLGQSGDGDGSVARGYALNDPNLLKVELEQTKMVMNIVRHKLLQFHLTLTTNLQTNVNPEVQVVVDGIYELSCLLKNHSKEGSCEIETACEAGEIKEPKTPTAPFNKFKNLEKLKSSSISINSEKRSHTLPRVKKGPKSGELTLFKHQTGGPMSGGPMIDPLHLIKNLKQNEYFQT